MTDNESKLLIISILLFISTCGLFFFINDHVAYSFVFNSVIALSLIDLFLIYKSEKETSRSPLLIELIQKSTLPIIGIIFLVLLKAYLPYSFKVSHFYLNKISFQALLISGLSLYKSWKNWR